MIDVTIIREAFRAEEIDNIGHVISEHNAADTFTNVSTGILQTILENGEHDHPVQQWIVKSNCAWSKERAQDCFGRVAPNCTPCTFLSLSEFYTAIAVQYACQARTRVQRSSNNTNNNNNQQELPTRHSSTECPILPFPLSGFAAHSSSNSC